ncbi:Putative diguanylate cyclase (GGDEF domain) with PAS/PAC and Chase2 sensors [Plesiocystis pacifica SIR-1]|uniref:Putative diguanylate cyclase (GGDEF domain) with PAS/PAC and Chase2 sensors n=2 Tax=Plesiocystis pacifica TaxID=191768 RepID=A6GBV7_9BACT|nr:Putative diguanylate cyclase (GGDEF domain) with PAS/PAC and Chase2 sensors [Plesiocystis pacifica SIR-1]
MEVAMTGSEPVPILEQDVALLQGVLDSLDDPVFVKDRRHRWVAFNDGFCKLLGQPREALLGKSDPDFFPPEQVEEFWRLDDQLFESGETNRNEERLTDEQGEVHLIWTRKYPMRDASGQVVGLVGIISDITELRERIEALDTIEREAAEQRARVKAQRELIDAMEAPIITLWAGILLVPIVGELSERRAQVVLERLLAAVARESTRVVFLDISGLPELTASSAATLRSAVSTARLLGAQAEIVGMRPNIARVLVGQGIELGAVQTHASLRDGLHRALRRLGVVA